VSKVSVILPTYNRAQHIVSTLNSVVEQTYDNFEIIVVDDGSTDNTYDIIAGFKKQSPYPVIYKYQNNKGPAAARNVGIKAASGEYIAFIDSDDIWHKDKIVKQLAIFRKNNNISMVFSDMMLSENYEKKADSVFHAHNHQLKFSEHKDFYYYLLNTNPIFTPTVMVKSECFEKVGLFNEDYKFGEDYDMWVRIASNYVHEFNKNGINIRKNHLRNFNMEIKECSLIKKGLGRDYFNYAYYLYDVGQMNKARQNFLSSLKLKYQPVPCLFYLLTSFLPSSLLKQLRNFKQQTGFFKKKKKSYD